MAGDLYDKYTAVSGGGKTLTQLQTICRYYGWNDGSATGLAELTNFINHTLQLLATLAPWPWYAKRNGSVTFPTKAHTISSVVDDDGGNVVVTTSAAHGLAVGDIVTVTGTTEYNESAKTITAVDTSTTLTYVSSVDKAEETSGTLTRDDNDYESLSDTRLDRMGVLIRTDRAAPLDEITADEWLLEKQYHAGTGPPTEYAVRKGVSSGNVSMELLVYPEVTTAITMYYTWHAHPLELSAGTDTTDWPTTRLWLLTAAFQMRLAAIDRDIAGIRLYEPTFMELVNRAFGQSKPSYKPILARRPKLGHKWGLNDIGKTITT